MTWTNIQLPLSEDEITQILDSCSQDCVLVGGQALAIWSTVYKVQPPAELAGGVSADMDFIGSVREAQALGKALNKAGGNWKLHEVAPGDFTPQTAKLSLTVKDAGYKEIDFLWDIAGPPVDKVKTRAVEMTVLGASKPVKIMHPLDVLSSKLHNLASIPQKRDIPGVSQGRLAIGVVGAFMRQALNDLPEREMFQFVEEIARIALDSKLDRVFYEYGFDVLAAVPAEKFKDQNFVTKRWPQIQERVANRRETWAKLMSRNEPWPNSIRAGDAEQDDAEQGVAR